MNGDYIDKLEEKNWLLEMLKQFDHPSTALWRDVEARRLRAILSDIIFEAPILDLRCGDGKLGTYVELILGDARGLPFRDENFNFVFSNCVVEHIAGTDRVLHEVSRILNKDRIFIFTVPS